MTSRRFFIPEVVQTSTIDCGPACLSALLGGFGIHASYGRLREACQTGVDGTSVDALEDLAVRLGLEAEQIVLPPDHLPLPEAAALPAITVVKLPTGFTHFVVVWRRHGSSLQVMDPATGRRWTPFAQFAKELYIHEMTVPAAGWREWAESEEFIATLKARAADLGLTEKDSSAHIQAARAASGWRALATMDAALRMLQALARQGAFKERSRASHLLRVTVARAMENPADAYRLIPPEYWTVRALNDDEVAVRGAVLVRVKGRTGAPADVSSLPVEVAAAVTEPPPRPAAELWRLLKQDGALAPAMVTAALLVSAAGTVLQALLFRALISGGSQLSAHGQRLGAVLAVLVLLLVLLAVEIPAIATLVGMGRRLEARFRRAFLMKLPRIADHYFNSRLTSDMAERSHSVHNIRALPALAGQIILAAFQLIATAAAVVWIDHGLWPLVLLSIIVSVGLPLAAQPLLGEREMRVRTHSGALTRFYLDSLLGLIPIRTHVADGVVRGEHRNLLAQWAAASLSTEKVAIALEGFQMTIGYGLAALLTLAHISRHPDSSAVLLVAYWGLNIPGIGRDLAARAATYPLYRSVILRLMEPLCAGKSDGTICRAGGAASSAWRCYFHARRVRTGRRTRRDTRYLGGDSSRQPRSHCRAVRRRKVQPGWSAAGLADGGVGVCFSGQCSIERVQVGTAAASNCMDRSDGASMEPFAGGEPAFRIGRGTGDGSGRGRGTSGSFSGPGASSGWLRESAGRGWRAGIGRRRTARACGARPAAAGCPPDNYGRTVSRAGCRGQKRAVAPGPRNLAGANHALHHARRGRYPDVRSSPGNGRRHDRGGWCTGRAGKAGGFTLQRLVAS